jgi:hypothetical protein
VNLSTIHHLVAVWFVGGKGQDWLATLYRESETGPWVLSYRFRYYAEEGRGDPFDKSDRKSWWRAESDDLTKLRAATEQVAAMTAKHLGSEVDVVEVNGPGMTFLAKAAGRPWLHIRREEST